MCLLIDSARPSAFTVFTDEFGADAAMLTIVEENILYLVDSYHLTEGPKMHNRQQFSCYPRKKELQETTTGNVYKAKKQIVVTTKLTRFIS